MGAPASTKLQSLFGAVRWLGGTMNAAWTAQALLVAGLAFGVCVLWRAPVRYETKAAALAAAALLATPYLYIYDFPVLAIPLAFLLRSGFAEGFLFLEWSAIAAACTLVLIFLIVAMPTGLAAAAIVAALIARRAAAELMAPAAPAMRRALVA
jgi:arabinofuranan 3-O-arabinosyltransferase